MLEFLVLLLLSFGNADKLNRLYLPPPNASSSGGHPGDIEIPLESLINHQNGHDALSQSTNSNFGPNESFSKTAYSKPLSPLNDVSNVEIPYSSYSKINTYPQKGFEHDHNEFIQNRIPENQSKTPLPQSNKTLNNYLNTKFDNGFDKPEQFSPLNTTPDIAMDSVSQSIQTNIKNISEPLRAVFITPNSMTPAQYNIKTPTSELSFNEGSNNLISYAPQNSVNNRKNLENTIQKYPERVQAEADRNAVIIKYDNVIAPDSYAYNFETSNGIHADENGTVTDGTKAKGSYSYIGDDGKNYTVIYTADENGFQPHGDHLPTSPPIPDEIIKALEHIAENEKNGIFDDGSYDDKKYGYKNYQNGAPGESEEKYFNVANNPRVHNNNFNLSKLSKILSQSGPEVRPISDEQSFIDNHNSNFDDDSDYEDDGDEFKQLSKSDNTNLKNSNVLNQVEHQLHQHKYENNNPTHQKGMSSETTINPIPDRNSFYGFPDQVLNNKEKEKFHNLQDAKSATSKPATTGYQYFPPQIGFTSQENLFPSRFAEAYRPKNEYRVTEDSFSFSTTNKPTVFTNGPVRTETESEDPAVHSIFDEKNKPEEISNKFGNPVDSLFQNMRKSFIADPKLETKDYSTPQYKSTTPSGLPTNIYFSSFYPHSDNLKNQPSTESNIEEEFSGPKQPQRYDPTTGYYYK